MNASEIFVNLPVKDLNKSVEFFTKLGFTFNPKFTNEQGTCMIIGTNIFAMLLVEPFFKTFTTKEIADRSTVEVLNCIALESRAKVDEIMMLAIAAGGKENGSAQDHGWMYSRSLEDIDGHIWELMHADESKIPDQVA